MFNRLLKLKLPKQQSTFLWGPRKTGKSAYLKRCFPTAIYYDLLDTRQFIELSKSPYLLKDQILAQSKTAISQPIIIDEVQKVPELLNEVHWLIENKKLQFILCGSSARKLKSQATNLLGGRAWIQHFYPLVTPEIPDFDLLKALQHGLIPSHYLSQKEFVDQHMQAYIDVYLKDEIRNEGLVKNLPDFARFLDVAGLTNGEMINLNNIARDCGINRSTVQNYYQILIDTMLGYFIYPYAKKIKRDIIKSTPKFYLFDLGIANYIAKKTINSLEGSGAGHSFEQFILMELLAYLGLMQNQTDITYWRTKSGLEVDFIINGRASSLTAIEVKISKQVHTADLKGLIAFCEEHPQTKAIVVSQDSAPRKLLKPIEIDILPWKIFLERLWSNELDL